MNLIGMNNRLMAYNPDTNLAVLEHKGNTLNVATHLLDPFPYKHKDLLQCIGEVDLDQEVKFHLLCMFLYFSTEHDSSLASSQSSYCCALV